MKSKYKIVTLGLLLASSQASFASPEKFNQLKTVSQLIELLPPGSYSGKLQGAGISGNCDIIVRSPLADEYSVIVISKTHEEKNALQTTSFAISEKAKIFAADSEVDSLDINYRRVSAGVTSPDIHAIDITKDHGLTVHLEDRSDPMVEITVLDQITCTDVTAKK